MGPPARSRRAIDGLEDSAGRSIPIASIAEGDPQVAGGPDRVRIDGNALDLAHGLLEGDRVDVGRVEGDHGTEAALGDATDGGGAEAEGDEAVVGRGRAAALEVPEDEGAGLAPCPLGDLAGEALGDPAEARGSPGRGGLHVDLLAAQWSGALRRDDDRVARSARRITL